MKSKLLFPIKRDEWFLFALMFAIVTFININFNILRGMRNTLVVADLGGSAAYIPYFELFGTFPASILLTWSLSRLMRRFSLRSIFSMAMLFFLAFFLVFAFWVYPHRQTIQYLLGQSWITTHWPDMIFYIMSELWKVALLSVIFWGFLNQNLILEQAKRFYPPLLLGSSIGAILAGPITVFCTSQMAWNSCPLSTHRWQHSLYLLTLFLLLSGVATLFLFKLLHKHLKLQESIPTQMEKEPFAKKLLSLSSSLKYLVRSHYLSSLLLIVIAEYVCYALGELVFLEILKTKYPSPTEYCQYMGTLTFWMGILTAASALFVTPYVLQRFKWRHTVIATPLVMVAITASFFSAIYLESYFIIPGLAVLLGSAHFCIARSAKNTLFDTIKELAFIPLNTEGQMKGKLIIDGIGSRMGRGGSSLLSILLIYLTGGVGESALFAGILAITFAIISLPAARFIGGELDQSNAPITVS